MGVDEEGTLPRLKGRRAQKHASASAAGQPYDAMLPFQNMSGGQEQ
jgi:hypothetical protein